MMSLVIGWTALSIVIGFVARARRDAFWPAFLGSLLLSPLVGFALTMLRLPETKHS